MKITIDNYFYLLLGVNSTKGACSIGFKTTSNNSLLQNQQFGFRKKKQYSYRSVGLTQRVRQCNRKEKINCFFLDLRKVLDTINYKILFDRLERYRLKRCML